MRHFIATTFVTAVIALTAAPAHAQPKPTPEQLELARQAFAKGKTAFDAKDFKTAIDAFKESYRLSRNPLLLYNIGITLEELGDKKLALFYYRKFLTDAPRDVPNRTEAAQAAAALSAELDGRAPPPDTDNGNGNGDGGNSGNRKAAPTEFQHNVVGEAPPGKPLDITAFAPQHVGWKVYLYYRSKNDPDFTKVEMKPRYQELVARIPAGKLSGSSIQYYVEARDAGDEVIARSGKATSPNIVMIDAEAKARYYPDLEDDRPWDPDEGSTGGNGRDKGKTDTMTYARWGATGGALGFLALSATFLFIASDASSAIEGAAFESTMQDNCPPQGRPCRTFDDQRDLESRGKRFELLGNVTLALALGAGAAAGVLWYMYKKDEKKKKGKSVSAAPALGRDFVGAAAQVSF